MALQAGRNYYIQAVFINDCVVTMFQLCIFACAVEQVFIVLSGSKKEKFIRHTTFQEIACGQVFISFGRFPGPLFAWWNIYWLIISFFFFECC